MRSIVSAAASSISITRPDDFHLHLRDGAGLRSVAPLSADVFKRAVIMPNLKQPVVRTAQVRLLGLAGSLEHHRFSRTVPS